MQNHCNRINNIELYALGALRPVHMLCKRALRAADVSRVAAPVAGIPDFPATGGCKHLYQFWW